jgi:hypothetical protein
MVNYLNGELFGTLSGELLKNYIYATGVACDAKNRKGSNF